MKLDLKPCFKDRDDPPTDTYSLVLQAAVLYIGEKKVTAIFKENEPGSFLFFLKRNIINYLHRCP
jgi:hypothetical protein